MMKHYTINRVCVLLALNLQHALQQFHLLHPGVRVDDILVTLDRP